MKIYIVFALVIFSSLHADDRCSPDSLAVDYDQLLLKPQKEEGIDCILKPLTYGKTPRQEEPSVIRKTDDCDARPEKCAITAYLSCESGGPTHSLSNIKTIIDYDPATGRGKVYDANIFGKTLKGQVGVVKRESSGGLIVYPSDIFGNADYSKPSQVVEGVKLPTGTKECREMSPILPASSLNLKVYPTDELGYRSLFADPAGTAKIECKK
jgi:hypothetical protein